MYLRDFINKRYHLLDSTPSKSDKKEKEKSSNSPEQTDSPSEMMDVKDSQGSEPGKTLMRQDSEASITNDPVRIKCRELLATSLVLDEEVKGFIVFFKHIECVFYGYLRRPI